MLLFQIFILFGFLSSGRSLDIFVDDEQGTANSSCWHTSSLKPCTLNTALLILAGHVNTNITYHLSFGKYSLSSDVSSNVINNVNYINFSGNYSTISCQHEAGLLFKYSTDLSFSRITFSQCGLTIGYSFVISQSFDRPTTGSYPKYRSALSFHYCHNITIDNVTIESSNGLGLDIRNTGGSITVKNSNFLYNRVADSELLTFLGGGGIAVVMHGDITGQSIAYSRYSIRGCTFLSNNVTYGYKMYYHFIYDSNDLNDVQANGGGVSIQLHNLTHDNRFVIEDCLFEDNSALYGGGLMMQFADESNGNAIQVKHCQFLSNKCFGGNGSPPACEGGGARVDFIHSMANMSNTNTLVFDDCVFSDNSASKGGGMSFIFSQVEESVGKMLNISNCTFSSNTATSGSALHVTSWFDTMNGYLPNILIAECRFFQNLVQSEPNTTLGMGCVYSNRVPIVFDKLTLFINNTGSALIVSGTEIRLAYSAQVLFINNFGNFGGGLALINKAWLTVSEMSHILFDRNTAHVHGGAVFAVHDGYQERQYSENCFVRYNSRFIHPSYWSANFTFYNNTASSKPNSIFTPSIASCTWPQSKDSTYEEDIMDTFCWNGWNYIDSECTDQIQTSVSYYKVSSIDREPYQLSVIPGREFEIPLELHDDKNNNLTAQSVFNAQIYGDDAYVHEYASNGVITLYGKPNTKAYLVLQTMYPRVLKIEFDVSFLPCPPGFVSVLYDKVKHSCQCSRGYSHQSIHCNAYNFTSYIQWGYFMTLNDNNQTLVAPWVTRNKVVFPPNLSPGYLELPQDVFQLNDDTCNNIGRTGFLCGVCLENKSAPVYAFSYECVDCTSDNYLINWFYLILVSLLPITIFFLIVVIFNISTTSGPLNAFIFFAQMLTNPITITRMVGQLYALFQGEHQILMNIILSVFIMPYSLWNLDFFQPIVPPLCIAPDMKSMHSYAINYTIAFYPLVLILLCYVLVELYAKNYRLVVCLWKPFSCCVRSARGNWNARASVVDAFATFFLLSYSKFCLLTFYLLVPVSAIDANGTAVGEKYLFFDPSVVYLSSEHIPYFILAISILLFVILPPPIILFVFPTKIFQRLLNYFNVQAMSLRMFLEPFQGCYKDGVSFGYSDCRYFSSLYFVIRILAFGTVTLSYELFLQRLVQLIFVSIFILLFCILRPYKDDYYNKLDPAIFTNLMIVISIGTYNAAVPNTSILINLLLVIFISLPFIYMVIYVAKNILGLIKLYCRSEAVDYRPRLSISVHRDSCVEIDLTGSIGSLPDRIIHPQHYRDDLSVNERAPLTRSEVHLSHDGYGSTD